MSVLVVESNTALRRIWAWHLVRHGLRVTHVADDNAAIEHLSENQTGVIIISLELTDGGAFAVADYASYRWPDASVIFVTRSSFFSDGSIFQHCNNACAILPNATKPEDLAAMASHYAGL